jgi:hypothetical protein
MRERKPDIYIRVVAGLLPKEANINVEANEAFVELWRRISDGLGDELADSLDEKQRRASSVHQCGLAGLMSLDLGGKIIGLLSLVGHTCALQ